MSFDQFEYNVQDLQEITPSGRDFRMLVTASHRAHYRHNAYEDFTADLLLSLSRDAALFIDVGAHYGFYTLAFGTAHPDRKILAFEPAPENFDVLTRNIELNRLQNVDAYNLAVLNQNGRKNFNVASHSSHSSFYLHHLSDTIRTVEVQVVSLDDFLKDVPSGSIVVKIDAEGSELEILNGMASLLQKKEDIRLVIEFNPNSSRAAGHDPGALLHEIHQFGFDLYFIDDETRQTFKLTLDRLDQWASYFGTGNFGKDYFNVFAVQRAKSLNICFFAHSALLRGAERSLVELATELVHDHGAICTVVLPEPGPLEIKLQRAGISTRILNYSWWCDSSLLGEVEINERLNGSFRSLLNMLPQIDRINPDIIYTSTSVLPWGAIAASFLGKPHVWSVNEFGQRDFGLHFYLPFPRIVEFIRDSSNLIVTISDAVRQGVFGSQPENNIITVHRYIEVPSVALLLDSPNYFTRTNATRLVIAGGITEAKGQAEAILAVKVLVQRRKDVELVVVGAAHPQYLNQLKQIVQHENLENYIKFIGPMENVYPVLNQAHIVLVCSRSEAAGRVALEAMLLKKAVVGTRAGGTVELVQEGFNGLLYEPGDYKELADKIEWLLDNQSKIRELGNNGYRFASENFTRERYGGRLYEFLRNLKGTPNRLSSAYLYLLTRLVQAEQAKHLITERNLLGELAQRDETLTTLRAELEHHVQELNQLHVELVRRGDAINTLQAERSAAQRSLVEGLAQRDETLAALRGKLEHRVQESDQLQVELWHRIEELHQAQADHASMKAERAWLLQQIHEIRMTKIWRIAMLYWSMHAWLQSRLRR